MPLRLTWRNALAILIAVGAVLTSVALWANGRVAIGLALAEGSQATELMPFPGNEEAILPGVFVVSVTPDGNAARNGIYPGARVVSLTTVDGRGIEGVSIIEDPGVGEVTVHSEFGDATDISAKWRRSSVSGLRSAEISLSGARVSLRARAPRPSNVDRGFPRRTPRPSSR